MTLDAQITEFVSLGAVGPAAGTDEATAEELADTLMRQPLAEGGPLARIAGLTRLLRVLKIATKIVTAQRDLAAFSANAIWPYRRLSKLASVHVSTMQGWIEAGRKVVERQDVPRETIARQ